jgi:hypothetical protein
LTGISILGPQAQNVPAILRRAVAGWKITHVTQMFLFAWEQDFDAFRPDAVAAAKINELAFPRVAKSIRWSSSVALPLNC